DFKAVGFKYSLEFVSTQPLGSAKSTILTGLYYYSANTVPVNGTFENNTGASLSGRVTVIVTGHGAEAGGNEYMNTQDTVSLNGTQLGTFRTNVDCASYAQYSPDGNPGIFRNNTTSNPRNWCPGELIPPRSFSATLNTGSNTVSLGISPSTVPMGSYYPTSFSFSSP
ncbi:MAG: peptide-N-glycosidase F-related protein, partial [Polyangiaceae bacterium]